MLAGQYYDGESAVSHSVTVRLGTTGLTIAMLGQNVVWLYTCLVFVQRHDATLRLASRGMPDALLVIPAAAEAMLHQIAPDVVTGRKERRRMRRLVLKLMAGSVLIGILCFFGVPMLAEPLVRITPKSFEITLGRNVASQIKLGFPVCEEQEEAVAATMPVLTQMADVADVGFPITLHYVDVAQPNAFALPGGQLLVTQGLLQVLSEDQEAFVAVLAHELGHVKARDGMQAFYRNIGVTAIIEAITGGSGLAQQSILLGSQVAEFRHSRAQETRADAVANTILLQVALDPAALGRALQQMTGVVDEAFFDFFSTHPDVHKRIANANAHAVPTGRAPFSPQDWETIKRVCHTRTN